MAVTIQIPTALRPFTEGQREISVEGATVGAALAALGAGFPDLKRHLWNDAGELRSFINVFLGETNVKKLSGLDTPLEAGATLMLVPAIAGGAPRREKREGQRGGARPFRCRRTDCVQAVPGGTGWSWA